MLQGPHDSLQFPNQPAGTAGNLLLECPGDFLIVPEGFLPGHAEPAPDFIADQTHVVDDGAGVVELVGGGDPEDVGSGFVAEMIDELLLAGFPGAFPAAGRIGIGTSHDDAMDPGSEPLEDFLLGLSLPGMILDRIVQQGADPFLFIAAVFQHDRGDTQQVGHEGNATPLTALLAVPLSGVEEGFGELRA